MPVPHHAHVVLIGSLLASLPGAALAQEFRYVQLDVGQGDAAVVVAPSGCAALFDGGPKGSGATIKAWLKSAGIQRLDFAVASHYDADHIGGLDEVATGSDAVQIDQVWDRGGSHSTVTFNEYATTYAGKRSTPTVGQTISLCPEVSVRFVAVNGNGLSVDENGRSVAARVSFGTLDLFLGGDLDEEVESLIRYDVGPVEVYKVDHHGSATSSADNFLYVLQPLVSFISVGVGNTYGHPTASALDRLHAYGSDVWQTEDPATGVKRGHLLLASSDGRVFTVSQAGTTKTYGTPATPPPGPPPLDPGSPGVVTGCSQAGAGLAPVALLLATGLPLLARRRRLA